MLHFGCREHHKSRPNRWTAIRWETRVPLLPKAPTNEFKEDKRSFSRVQLQKASTSEICEKNHDQTRQPWRVLNAFKQHQFHSSFSPFHPSPQSAELTPLNSDQNYFYKQKAISSLTRTLEVQPVRWTHYHTEYIHRYCLQNHNNTPAAAGEGRISLPSIFDFPPSYSWVSKSVSARSTDEVIFHV